MTFRELYVKEMDEITFSEGFEVRTANLMKQRAVRKDEKVLQKRKPAPPALRAGRGHGEGGFDCGSNQLSASPCRLFAYFLGETRK